jgi:hypothetical protein
MSDHITPAQRERMRQQAQRRQAEQAEDRRARQAQLAAALENADNRAKADALLAPLLVPNGPYLTRAEMVTAVAVAALVLDGVFAHVRDWSGEKWAAELRTHLRRLQR